MLNILKFILRVLGCACLAVAIIAGISDASRSIAQSALVLKPLGQAWFEVSPGTLNLTQAVLQRHVHPAVWDPVIQTVLTWPVWAVFAGAGLMFLWMGARRRTRRLRFA